ncbi:MAG: DNA/pantothenate metabolism flavoprotein domain protein [Verrucomicrobia bacterium]|nr:DNA/pantothenate metabolism flavoprotein domain protein [Verrucomicrobiota bacterium]
MKVIVTCGPSYEPIDQARRLTNFSTGRLGIALANAFTRHGWEVACLKGEQATCADPLHAKTVQTFSTNEDLAQKLETLSRAGKVDAVFHAAALCDFKVARVENEAGETIVSPKFSTREGGLRLVLVPTLKVLPELRDWFPNAKIAGWKYELAGTRAEAFEAAGRQLRGCRTDACVLNGAAYGSGFALCTPDKSVKECADADALAEELLRWVM